MDAWKNLSATGYTVTDELYTNFGTTKRILNNWPAYKGASLAIYTDATPHAGDALIQDVDYVLEDIDSAKTTEYSENIYTKLRMINNSTGDIYISYVGLGSYVDMDVFQNILTHYTPATLNISADNQVTDLSVYERGGASEKWNGWRIKVSWTGGVTARTYSHLFTGTGYKIGGLAIANYAGYTYGWLLLELDKTNGDWKIIDSDWIFEQTSSGALALNTTFTFAHGLGSIPKMYDICIVNTSAEHGYAVGDEAKLVPNYYRAAVGELIYGMRADATNIYFMVNSTGLKIMRASPLGEGDITVAKWKVRVRYK